MTNKAKPSTGAWVFSLDEIQSWAYWDGMFSAKECADIVAIGKKRVLSNAQVGASPISVQDTKAVRKSRVSWIYPDEETNWIFERMAYVVLNLNSNYFKFDLFGLVEGLQFTEYVAPSGFYGPHLDMGEKMAPRKLSVSIQLSPDEDYEGGELLLHQRSQPFKAPTAQGKAIVFPSYTLHEVTPVTKGTRYSLVCWVTGAPFK